jgi:hypothetical protein
LRLIATTGAQLPHPEFRNPTGASAGFFLETVIAVASAFNARR